MEGKEDKPEYDFIKRDDNDSAAFHCSHEEVKGRFVVAKYTVGREMDVESTRSYLQGATPSQRASQLAEQIASLMHGFKESPDNFEPTDIEDPQLLKALYAEVARHWRDSFRQR